MSIPGKDRMTRRSLYIGDRLWEQAQQQAREEHRSTASLIKQAMAEYLAKRGSSAGSEGGE